MKWNRNTCLIVGVVALLLGLELRMVDSAVLNGPISERMFHEHAQRQTGATGMLTRFAPAVTEIPRQTLKIPRWLGLALVSTGAVLTLQSFVMDKPTP